MAPGGLTPGLWHRRVVTATDFRALASRVQAAPARLGSIRLVVVDGPAGSGKTTLAGRLAAALDGAPVVHMDDLYEGWTGLRAGVWERLESQLLAPLRSGQPGEYQVYDWDAARFARWVTVPVAEVVVLEGVGAAARPVDPWASRRLWVEVGETLRMQRGVARDGEALRHEWVRWAGAEAEHFAADGTRDRADLVVDGSA